MDCERSAPFPFGPALLFAFANVDISTECLQIELGSSPIDRSGEAFRDFRAIAALLRARVFDYGLVVPGPQLNIEVCVDFAVSCPHLEVGFDVRRQTGGLGARSRCGGDAKGHERRV